MPAKRASIVTVVVLLGVVAGGWMLLGGGTVNPRSRAPFHEQLFAEVQPVALSNCDLQRFGEANDGGYLMCANLLGGVASGYSYGISGYDGWGCEIATRFNVPVHQYDCFDVTEPACPGGRTIFHAECVGNRRYADEDGRLFDTPESQFERNGDGANRVVVKMDVEGAEWDTFVTAPDEVLEQIDQLAVEFHGIARARYVAVVRRLKRFFVVAHLHYNNHTCRDDVAPFPSEVFEVLFVNKRIAKVASGRRVELPHPQDAPNDPHRPDCQIPRR